MRKIAAIGDIHGCLEELQQLLKQLEWFSLDEIWHLGDLVDRGPDSGACVALMRENKIPGVLGNHEESIIKHWERVLVRSGPLPQNEDKKRTLSQMTPDDIDYLRNLPKLHVFDDLKLVLVHGGLFPNTPLYQQPHNVIRAQMVHPFRHDDTRWWGQDAKLHKTKRTEEQNKQDGYHRWYEIYDQEYDCVYGHSVWSQPFIHQNIGFGKTIGIDNGSCFGGSLTAAIFDGTEFPTFLSIKSRKVWFEKSHRIHQEM